MSIAKIQTIVEQVAEKVGVSSAGISFTDAFEADMGIEIDARVTVSNVIDSERKAGRQGVGKCCHSHDEARDHLEKIGTAHLSSPDAKVMDLMLADLEKSSSRWASVSGEQMNVPFKSKAHVVDDCGHCSGHGQVHCSRCSGHGEVHCRGCGGHGEVRCHGCGGDGRGRCRSCSGTGTRYVMERDINGTPVQNRVTCNECYGIGRSPRVNCTMCGGRRTLQCSGCGGRGLVGCGTCSSSGNVECSPCSGHGAFVTQYSHALRSHASHKHTLIGDIDASRGEELKTALRDMVPNLGRDKSFVPEVMETTMDGTTVVGRYRITVPYWSLQADIFGTMRRLAVWGEAAKWVKVPPLADDMMLPVYRVLKSASGEQAPEAIAQLRETRLGADLVQQEAGKDFKADVSGYFKYLTEGMVSNLVKEIQRLIGDATTLPRLRFWKQVRLFNLLSGPAAAFMVMPILPPSWIGSDPLYLVYAGLAVLLGVGLPWLLARGVYALRSRKWTRLITGLKTVKSTPAGGISVQALWWGWGSWALAFACLAYFV